MYKKLLLLIFPILMNCQGKENKNSVQNKQEEQLLNEITTNSKVVITDITEINKKPSRDFNLITNYSLSKEKKEEYDKNGSIVNGDNDLSDIITYKVLNYNLTNEKNETLEILLENNSNSLQEFALSEKKNVLYQGLGIKFKVNNEFEKLNGYLNIEYELNNKKTVKIPVNISVLDTITE